MAKPPEVPDLDLPLDGLQLRNPATSQPPSKPMSGPGSGPASGPRSGGLPAPDLGDVFGGGIERGSGSLQPPSSGLPRGKSVEFNMPASSGGDDWDDGIERGGGYEPAQSSRNPPMSSRGPHSGPAPASMNLDVAYRRPTAAADTDHDEPGLLEKLGGRVMALAGIAAAVVPLVKYIHRSGRFLITKPLPHAYDATSLPQSGAVAGVLLVSAIALGYLGIKARPRSWAMIVSSVITLVSSLAMVTVALVATDEQPSPPDGARLIPYTVPLAFILLGLGVSSRGQYPYYYGGAKRALPFVAGVVGGLLIYVGYALSAFG